LKKESRPISETEVKDYPAIIFPEDLNSQDTMFGGMLVAAMDKVAGSVFFMHTDGQSCGTKTIDEVPFNVTVYKGDLLLLDASINRVWGSSCEIGVRARVKRKRTGVTQNLSSTYFTYVATEKLDEIDPETGHPKIVAVPIIYNAVPQTEEQKQRWHDAGRRRKRRLKK
jgi:acyl-CoA hydrolase